MTDEQLLALAWHLEELLLNVAYQISEELWREIDDLVEDDKQFGDED